MPVTFGMNTVYFQKLFAITTRKLNFILFNSCFFEIVEPIACLKNEPDFKTSVYVLKLTYFRELFVYIPSPILYTDCQKKKHTFCISNRRIRGSVEVLLILSDPACFCARHHALHDRGKNY